MANVRPPCHGGVGDGRGMAAPTGPSMLRNATNMPPANGMKSRVAHAPVKNAKPQGPEMADFIEHNKKDSKGNMMTKRYQKGQLLGKGGFAKCYQVKPAVRLIFPKLANGCLSLARAEAMCPACWQ